MLLMSYNATLLSQVIEQVAQQPQLLDLTESTIHQATKLPNNRLEVLVDKRKDRQTIAEEIYISLIDASNSRIKVEGLKDPNLPWLTEFLALQLFGHQMDTHSNNSAQPFGRYEKRPIPSFSIQQSFWSCGYTNIHRMMEGALKWLMEKLEEGKDVGQANAKTKEEEKGRKEERMKETREQVAEALSKKKRRKRKDAIEEEPTPEEKSMKRPPRDKGVQIEKKQPQVLMDSQLRIDWAKKTPDGLIRLEQDERVKVFEDGLDRKECELFNHEAWKPLFTENVIQILTQDLKLGAWILKCDKERKEMLNLHRKIASFTQQLKSMAKDM
eukprot:Gb_35684 [translate_table: standard]